MTVTIDQMLTAYLRSRQMRLPVVTTGKKILEEGQELVDAICEGNLTHIEYEIGDAALTLAVIARRYALSVEGCIAAKTFHDAARGEPAPEKSKER